MVPNCLQPFSTIFSPRYKADKVRSQQNEGLKVLSTISTDKENVTVVLYMAMIMVIRGWAQHQHSQDVNFPIPTLRSVEIDLIFTTNPQNKRPSSLILVPQFLLWVVFLR